MTAASTETSIERPLGPPAVKKLESWDLFKSIGSPRFVVAVSSNLHACTFLANARLFCSPWSTNLSWYVRLSAPS